MTRLGLYINNARRQTKDKNLARRMKDLLKEWKILVQNSQSNGVGSLTTPASKTSSASEIATPAPVVTVSEETPGEGVATKSNPQLSHRKLLLNKLSAFKKPQTTPTAAPPTVESVNTLLPTSLPPPSLPPPLPVTNGKGSSSLTVSLSLNRLPRQQEIPGQLVVSIPLALIRVSGRDHSSAVSEDQALSLPSVQQEEQSSPLSSQSLSPPVISFGETKRTPSLPPPSPSPPLPPPPLPPTASLSHHTLIVSIPRSLLATPTLVTAAMKALPSTTQQVRGKETVPGKHPGPSSHDSSNRLLAISPEQPVGRLKSLHSPSLLPPDCLPGFNGIVGDDGCWYSWTDIIPHDKPTVTILPYVYIDGLEMDDFCD